MAPQTYREAVESGLLRKAELVATTLGLESASFARRTGRMRKHSYAEGELYLLYNHHLRTVSAWYAGALVLDSAEPAFTPGGWTALLERIAAEAPERRRAARQRELAAIGLRRHSIVDGD